MVILKLRKPSWSRSKKRKPSWTKSLLHAVNGLFFQLVNHGMSSHLVDEAREVWREFFQPMEIKQKYTNTSKIYEGYGSRLGIEKGAILDWSDYYFLNYLPSTLKDHNKWPSQPPLDVTEEYSNEIVRLGKVLLKVFSINLGLQDDYLQDAFGGNDIGACIFESEFLPKMSTTRLNTRTIISFNDFPSPG
ncbi:isopenicillin N synthase [Artemisia annua]|uniref:Isopenicillin N synthase n=1 Tax=Artemisia annua TaxID=35608 RepID=A0A2U1LTM6_ARTAN|nr:isopenicillin N synthase [Artemisia annua]